jgi:hypothetical protein
VDGRWFFEVDEERDFYLYLLGRALERSDWRCVAYALMSNHIHLGVIAGERPMSSWTISVNSPFAAWMNKRRRRKGPVFAERAKDYRVLPAHEGSVIAYIHNNPVRAGVVKRPQDSNWTSHRDYLGLSHPPEWLAVEDGLARSGFDDPRRFGSWVEDTHGESGEVWLDRLSRTLARRGALEIGTPVASGGAASVPLFMRRGAHIRPDPGRIVALVSEVCAVPQLILCSRRRIPEAVAARAVAAHCARATGVTTTDLAAALGVSPQAVSAMTRRPVPPELRVRYEVVLARIATELWGDRLTFDAAPTP